MIDLKKTVDVTNRSAGHLVYQTSFGRRSFAPGQTRHNITLEELQELAQNNGATGIVNFLYIEDPSVMKEVLEIDTQPEYYLNEKDLPEWMNSSSLDEFKDALDFAPQGIKDLICKLAVSMPLNDYSKRQAIKEQLDFDVSAMIDNMKPDEDEKVIATKPTERRVAPAENTGRRTQVKIEVPKK